jgi:hypothetical protein
MIQTIKQSYKEALETIDYWEKIAPGYGMTMLHILNNFYDVVKNGYNVWTTRSLPFWECKSFYGQYVLKDEALKIKEHLENKHDIIISYGSWNNDPIYTVGSIRLEFTQEYIEKNTK